MSSNPTKSVKAVKGKKWNQQRAEKQASKEIKSVKQNPYVQQMILAVFGQYEWKVVQLNN